MFSALKILLLVANTLTVLVEKGSDARLKCVSEEMIEQCNFKSPQGEKFKYSRNMNLQNGRITCLCKTEKYKFRYACGILVKNITDQDFGNWRCVVKTKDGWGATVLPVEKEDPTNPNPPGGEGMEGSKGKKCFDGEHTIEPNKLLGTVAEMGPVWRVSFEMLWEGAPTGENNPKNIIHFTTWSAEDFDKEIPLCRSHDVVGYKYVEIPNTNVKNRSELCEGLAIPLLDVKADDSKYFWMVKQPKLYMNHGSERTPYITGGDWKPFYHTGTHIVYTEEILSNLAQAKRNDFKPNQWYSFTIGNERVLEHMYKMVLNINGFTQYSNTGLFIDYAPKHYKNVNVFLGKVSKYKDNWRNDGGNTDAAKGKVRNVCVEWDTRRIVDTEDQ